MIRRGSSRSSYQSSHGIDNEAPIKPLGVRGDPGTPRREMSQSSGLERVDQGGSEWMSRELVGVVSRVNDLTIVLTITLLA